jgi:DNA-binding TFAR19-related protein (PDSD5 family)
MAVKSKNRLNVFINQNFIIRVQLLAETDSKLIKLTSANKLSDYLQDEQLKIKLFNKAIQGGKQEYTFKIRKRLKIVFRSK